MPTTATTPSADDDGRDDALQIPAASLGRQLMFLIRWRVAAEDALAEMLHDAGQQHERHSGGYDHDSRQKETDRVIGHERRGQQRQKNRPR